MSTAAATKVRLSTFADTTVAMPASVAACFSRWSAPNRLNRAPRWAGHGTRRPEDLALPSALALDQSLLLAWWQIVALVAGTTVLFVVAYLAFMRQEIRA